MSLGCPGPGTDWQALGAPRAQDRHVSETLRYTEVNQKKQSQKTAHIQVWASIALNEWFPLPACACVLIRKIEHFIHMAAAVSFRGGSVEEAPSTWFSLLGDPVFPGVEGCPVSKKPGNSSWPYGCWKQGDG